MRVISGDERFLINHSSKMLQQQNTSNYLQNGANEYTNTETQKEAL